MSSHSIEAHRYAFLVLGFVDYGSTTITICRILEVTTKLEFSAFLFVFSKFSYEELNFFFATIRIAILQHVY